MPAAVVVVHDEPNTRELAVTAVGAAFFDVIGFDDPMAALNAIEMCKATLPALGQSPLVIAARVAGGGMLSR